MKQIACLIIVILAILFFSCEKQLDKVCHLSNPLELRWLEEYINENSFAYGTVISKAIIKDIKKHKKIDGIIISYNIWGLYNCDGELLCGGGGVAGFNTCKDSYEVIKEEVIYIFSTEFQ